MWYHKNTYTIGGLENIGYADNPDDLIVLSSQERRTLNCVFRGAFFIPGSVKGRKRTNGRL
jgi:hypothetical protein